MTYARENVFLYLFSIVNVSPVRFVLHLQDWWCVGKCETSFPVNKLWLIYLLPSLWPLTMFVILHVLSWDILWLQLFCSNLGSEKYFNYRWTRHILWCISKANLYLELSSLVSKVRFMCKLFSFFQSNQDNGGSTVGSLALTWECRKIHMRVVLARNRKPLPKQMHYKLLLKRREQ